MALNDPVHKPSFLIRIPVLLHCNAKQGRTGNKQGNPVMKTRLSCNHYRIYPFTRKNSKAYRSCNIDLQYKSSSEHSRRSPFFSSRYRYGVAAQRILTQVTQPKVPNMNPTVTWGVTNQDVLLLATLATLW